MADAIPVHSADPKVTPEVTVVSPEVAAAIDAAVVAKPAEYGTHGEQIINH